MKRLLWLLLFLSVLASAQTQQTITGLVSTTTGVPATSGKVQFDISPYSTSTIYTIPGLTVLTPITQITCGIDGTGHVKSISLSSPCQIWGNDLISPANTTYTVTLFPNGRQTLSIKQVCFKGAGPTDLSNLTFCPVINITPQYNILNVPPVSADVIPQIDGFFHLGVPGAGFYQGTITGDPVFATDIANKKYVDSHGGGGVTGLQDPGANGPIKRTSLNTTAPMTYQDVVALWSGGCDITKVLFGDGVCRAATGGVNTGTINKVPFYVSTTSLSSSPLGYDPVNGGFSYTAEGSSTNMLVLRRFSSSGAGSSYFLLGQDEFGSTLFSLSKNGTYIGQHIFSLDYLLTTSGAACQVGGAGVGVICSSVVNTGGRLALSTGPTYSAFVLFSDFLGNATKVVTAAAPGTAGHFMSWDSNGNAVDSGFTSSSFMTNPMIAANDMIVGGASGVPTRVASIASKCWTTDGSGTPGWNACPIAGANINLSNLASTAVNVDILPGIDNSISIGSASKRYLNMHTFQVTFYGATSGSCGLTATATGTGLINTCSIAGANNWTAIADPGSPSNGDDWYSSTTAGRRKFYDGTSKKVYGWMIASGTVSLGTGAITSGTCATAVQETTVTVGAVADVATTDMVNTSPNGDPTGITGYGPSASGSLYVWAYPTAGHVNFKVCNNTSGSITPGAATWNWQVVR